MELSESTLNILKNFATINTNLIVEPGNVITSMSPSKSVISRAEVDEQFSTEFAIWELPKFLGVISLFNKPEFKFGEKQVEISSGKQKTKYTYADPKMVEKPKSIKWPAGDDISFDLTAADITKTLKALAVLSLVEIAFVADGKTLSLQAINSKNPTADSFHIELGTTDKVFTAIFKAENIKIMNNKDYKVVLSPRKIMHLTTDKLQYWIVAEENSKFD